MTRPEAEAIARLSTLERLRDQARAAERMSMLKSLETLIEQELRGIRHLRQHARETKPNSDV